MKNVLILTGSPRKNGNSDMMADAFIKGALNAGCEVAKFEAGRKNIAGCKACKACWSKGSPCMIHDDFDELAPLLEAADAIVIATPLYWYSFSAQIKAAIDRLYTYQVDGCKRPLKISESYLLVCAEEEKTEAFDGVVTSYNLIAEFMNWDDKGKLIVPGVSEKGDIETGDWLSRAEELGKTCV